MFNILKKTIFELPTYNFRETVWGVLTGQGTENTPNLVMHDVREIETWILRLLSAPVPVPGKTRVEVIIMIYIIVTI